MTKITLTDEQYEQILCDYNAAVENRKKLTKDQLERIATELNGKIDVPLISEETEKKILVKIIKKVDRFLYDNLPNEIYDLIRSTEDGINDKEARTLIVRLSKMANKKIDIPYIPELMEYIAISFVMGIIINSMRKHLKLDTVLKTTRKIHVPKDGNVEKTGEMIFAIN